MPPDANGALLALADSGETRFWKAPFEQLSQAEQTFRLVWELEGEVNNGGFEQHFFNSSGDIARLAPDALREIGAAATADCNGSVGSVWREWAFGESGIAH